MGPVVVNGSIHTAHKQHQRKKHSNLSVRRVASRVLCELGLKRDDHASLRGWLMFTNQSQTDTT